MHIVAGNPALEYVGCFIDKAVHILLQVILCWSMWDVSLTKLCIFVAGNPVLEYVGMFH